MDIKKTSRKEITGTSEQENSHSDSFRNTREDQKDFMYGRLLESKMRRLHVELSDKNSRYFKKNLSELIDAESENLVEIMNREFFDNKSEILVFTTFEPVLMNRNALDLLIEKKIPFTSLMARENAEVFSDALIYASNKLALGRGGNKNAAMNTITPANEFAKQMGSIIEALDSEGYKSLESKANELNARGIKTMRNNDWKKMTVKRTLERWQALKAEEENEASSPSKGKTPKPE